MYRIAQGTAESAELDLHDVSLFQLYSLPKAQRMRAQKMDVHVSRAPMQFEFEVMMLQVAQAVGHFLLAAGNRLRPEWIAAAGDAYRARHGSKIGSDDQLGSDRTSAQLRTSQIEIILLLEAMVRELVALGHTNAIGPALRTNDIYNRDLGLFATVVRVGGDEQRFAVRVHDRTITLVKPLRGNPDFSWFGAAGLHAPVEHLHAVGQLLL